ncbi:MULTISPECIES: hypothetical protein [Sanguibacteroides]|uniref:Uncharacterized protein n=1 Tax=Sanguibacteroides justesenii TaxID=1547597 RepID=A0A0C3RLD8_9PORP|nr:MULTISPECIES: hypothetical protein [Sanguibacteroides]KIO46246.1 hypothetical protein IE90_05475 [Sanguibacteroides justesenii]KIO47494.1 hypothetical protein BA92_00300 [Sanguibacteroides justesenii]PXZ44307.1 hypothetical protein DMB45_06565 [Sanguibacteroides justesenii]
MEFLKKVVYILNLCLYVFFALFFIFTKQWLFGGIILVSSGVFVIGYKLSESMMVSRRDRYRNSEWGLFLKKIVWANNGALMTFALLVIVVVWLGNEQIAGLFIGE